MPALANTVLVFDLDDTLYAERDYQRSGIDAVCEMLVHTHGRDIKAEIDAFVAAGGNDIWGEACRLLGLPKSAAHSMLWTYRLHRPAIALDASTAAMVAQAKAGCRAVAILTDGRSITQRLKLQALGLGDLPVWISDEHGSEKPDPARFIAIMRDLPGTAYVYVADNPKKDFIAPNALGWLTIGISPRDEQVHDYDLSALCEEQHPTKWVTQVENVLAAVEAT